MDYREHGLFPIYNHTFYLKAELPVRALELITLIDLMHSRVWCCDSSILCSNVFFSRNVISLFFPLRKYCSYCIAICVNWVMSFCVTQCTIDVVYYMYVFKSNTLGETRGVTLIDTNIHFVNKWGINVAPDLNYQRDDACNQIETCRHPFFKQNDLTKHIE